MARETVLILGGTSEGRELASLLADHPTIAPLTSLAGVTSRPQLPMGDLRVGGFGGAEGLLAWLRANPLGAIVDASHPFATAMTRQAVGAAHKTKLPYLRLERPPWESQPGDRWHQVDDLAEALTLLPRLGRRVLVALGRSWVERLPELDDLDWIVRSIERPVRLPRGAFWLEMRLPLLIGEERRMLVEQRIEVILAKAAGGDGAKAKLDAARLLGLPMVLIRRPPPPEDVTIVKNVEEAVRWLDQLLGARGRST